MAGVFRLGGVISFISHPVMVGFTAAAALLIAASHLGGVLGISVEGGGVIERVARVIDQADQINPTALAIVMVALGTILVSQRLSRRLPCYLLALVAGIFAGAVLGTEEAGIFMLESSAP